jgi:hypothetical protein
MRDVSLNEFGKAVQRSRLCDGQMLKQRAAAFRSDASYSDHSAKSFAKFLIEQGDLTRFQAERLLAGRSEGFFLGGCKILGLLGAGGMGKVYLAE